MDARSPSDPNHLFDLDIARRDAPFSILETLQSRLQYFRNIWEYPCLPVVARSVSLGDVLPRPEIFAPREIIRRPSYGLAISSLRA